MSTAPYPATILAEACRIAGITGAPDAELVRDGENVVYRLPGAVIARISRAGQLAAAAREVAVSRWLNSRGVAAVATVDGIDQPVEVHRRPVTFWKELAPHQPGSPTQIAEVLAALHTLPVPDHVRLGRLDPFVRLTERLRSADIPEDDRDWLLGREAGLRSQWDALAPGLATCVVHGDAWAGNIAATTEGTVVLLDLERCSVGPPEWDLVSTAIKVTTDSNLTWPQYRQFTDAYGRDVIGWPHFELLRDIRELRIATYAAQHADRGGLFRQQADLRIACLRGKAGPRPWRWTAVN